MRKLIAFVFLFLGALLCINACTGLDATTVGHFGQLRISGALLGAGILAWVLVGKGK
jgi:hypothetical protein